MKVTTKAILGPGTLFVILGAILLWHAAQVERLAEVNSDLAAIQSTTAQHSLQLLRLADQLDENARKYDVTRDTAYARLLADARDNFNDELTMIQALDLSEAEREAVGLLWAFWQDFEMAEVFSERHRDEAVAESDGLPSTELLGGLAQLRDGARGILAASKQTMAEQVNQSMRAAGRAQWVSWCILTLGLVTSPLILLLTVRTIRQPLARVGNAARQVGKGDFKINLDTSSNDEFSEVSAAFNTMAARLGEGEQLKRDFLSHMSHELKTPLVAVQEINRLLLDEVEGQLSEAQRRFLELNQSALDQLSKMIRDLLDLSSLEAGAMQYNFGPCDLSRLVHRAASMFEGRAHEASITLSVMAPETPVAAECDKDRIIQVVQNLLDNALKHTPRGGAVAVTLRVPDEPFEPPRRECDGGGSRDRSGPAPAVLIEVTDSGPGVDQKDRARIFEKFYQSSTGPAGATRGVGLGLSICRQLVEAHQGSIRLGESDGAGARFEVLLPLSPGPGTLAGPRGYPAPGA